MRKSTHQGARAADTHGAMRKERLTWLPRLDYVRLPGLRRFLVFPPWCGRAACGPRRRSSRATACRAGASRTPWCNRCSATSPCRCPRAASAPGAWRPGLRGVGPKAGARDERGEDGLRPLRYGRQLRADEAHEGLPRGDPAPSRASAQHANKGCISRPLRSKRGRTSLSPPSRRGKSCAWLNAVCSGKHLNTNAAPPG